VRDSLALRRLSERLDSSWVWFTGLAVAVIFLFVLLYRLTCTIEPDESKVDGEKWSGGGE